MAQRKKRTVPVPRLAERVLDTALDKALAVQRPVVLAYLDRTRAKHPDLTPEQVVRQLERRYLTAVAGIGGAAGATAAVPGTGTTASLASGAAEITAFVSASAMYVLALAELHGVPVSDPEVRRALVVAVLLGEGGTAAVDLGVAGETRHWAQLLNRPQSRDKLGPLNHRMARMLLTRFGARQGALLLGRALPLGIGAGIGAVGNLALARAAISTARAAFGPPPRQFPPRVVDVAVRPD